MDVGWVPSVLPSTGSGGLYWALLQLAGLGCRQQGGPGGDHLDGLGGGGEDKTKSKIEMCKNFHSKIGTPGHDGWRMNLMNFLIGLKCHNLRC